MKKIFLGIALSIVVLQGCRHSDDSSDVIYTVADTADQQNNWDDTSIAKYLDSHYFDDRGNIVAFDNSEGATGDDNEEKLSDYDVHTLPSGVIYIKRADSVQPNPGVEIGATDKIHIMENVISYLAAKDSSTGDVSLVSGITFDNTINGTGDLVPKFDPSWYYVKTSAVKAYNEANSTSYDRSFFEIEGLREGLSYFKAFDLDDSADYNLQGVIIVPSRAAFARDPYYTAYTTYSLNDRTFIFNFQVYKTETRNMETED